MPFCDQLKTSWPNSVHGGLWISWNTWKQQNKQNIHVHVKSKSLFSSSISLSLWNILYSLFTFLFYFGFKEGSQITDYMYVYRSRDQWRQFGWESMKRTRGDRRDTLLTILTYMNACSTLVEWSLIMMLKSQSIVGDWIEWILGLTLIKRTKFCRRKCF